MALLSTLIGWMNYPINTGLKFNCKNKLNLFNKLPNPMYNHNSMPNPNPNLNLLPKNNRKRRGERITRCSNVSLIWF